MSESLYLAKNSSQFGQPAAVGHRRYQQAITLDPESESTGVFIEQGEFTPTARQVRRKRLAAGGGSVGLFTRSASLTSGPSDDEAMNHQADEQLTLLNGGNPPRVQIDTEELKEPCARLWQEHPDWDAAPGSWARSHFQDWLAQMVAFVPHGQDSALQIHGI